MWYCCCWVMLSLDQALFLVPAIAMDGALDVKCDNLTCAETPKTCTVWLVS